MEEVACRHNLRHTWIVFRSEADVDAGVEQLARLLGFASEAVDDPPRLRSDVAA